MSRPEWVKCIHYMYDVGYCGRSTKHEWAFVDETHAKLTVEQGGRLVPCDACVKTCFERGWLVKYFASLGCNVDFESGEVRTKDTNELRAELGRWKVDEDGDGIHVYLKLVEPLEYIPVSITVGGSNEGKVEGNVTENGGS